MKMTKAALALLSLGALGMAVPPVGAATQGTSASHRQDAAHGHKGKKGGNSADHRQDTKHGHKGKKGGNSADHRQDGSHRNDKAGDKGQ